jgi:hypothetical protein
MFVKILPVVALSALLSSGAAAHHGGTSLSQGAGSPIETNSPLTLPQGTTVLFTRAELVSFRKFADAEPYNTDSFNFFQLGASYGVTDALAVTAIVPINNKNQDNHGSFTGVGDAKVYFTLGMNYAPDEGIQLNGPDDVAINLSESPKTYFAIFAGVSAPTGSNHIDKGLGVEPGLQPGFGSFNYALGASVTKALTPEFSVTGDVIYDIFTPYRSGDKFGNEFRADLAGVYRFHSDDDALVRQFDGILELNYLSLARDRAAGLNEPATGGRILYLSPGARLQVGDFNLGLLVKFPLASALNEREFQQGAEGLEKYRLIFTTSTTF